MAPPRRTCCAIIWRAGGQDAKCKDQVSYFANEFPEGFGNELSWPKPFRELKWNFGGCRRARYQQCTHNPLVPHRTLSGMRQGRQQTQHKGSAEGAERKAKRSSTDIGSAKQTRTSTARRYRNLNTCAKWREARDGSNSDRAIGREACSQRD